MATSLFKKLNKEQVFDNFIDLYDTYETKDEIFDDLFVHACEKERLDMIYWIQTIKELDAKTAQRGFIAACKTGKIDYVTTVIGNIKKEYIDHQIVSQALIDCVAKASFDFIKWLYGMLDKMCNDSTIKGVNIRTLYVLSVNKRDDLEIVKYFYELVNDEVIINIKDIFYTVCEKGHINVAKWIYELSDKSFDLHKDEDELFINACIKGHLEMAEWLYELGAKYDAQNDRAFMDSCELYYDIVRGNVEPHDNMHENRLHNTIVWLRNLDPECYNIGWRTDGWDIKEFGVVCHNPKFKKACKENKLDELYQDAKEVVIDDVCSICMDDEVDKYVKFTRCKHMVCANCYIQIVKCSFGCETYIHKINLLKVKH